MYGHKAIGAGLERTMSGCPAAGLCVPGQPLCGSKADGCDGLVDGSGWEATGNNQRKPSVISLLQGAFRVAVPGQILAAIKVTG